MIFFKQDKNFLGIVSVKLKSKKYRINLKNQATVFLTVKQKANTPDDIYYDGPFDSRYSYDSLPIQMDCGTLVYKNGIASMTVNDIPNTHEAKFNKYEVVSTMFWVFKDRNIIFEEIS